jgi:hypothetical protein
VPRLRRVAICGVVSALLDRLLVQHDFIERQVAMAQQSLDSSRPDGQTVEEEALVPRDERFWQRYSPHHEFPLSSAASIALHVLAIGVLVLGGVLAAKWGLDDSEKAIPISIMDEPGGQPEDSETGTGGGGAVQSKEQNESPQNAVTQAPPTPKENLDSPQADPLKLPQVQDPSARYINESAEAMKGLAKLDEQARKNLFNSLRDPTKGKGGSGSGGGKGAGTGSGTGSGTRPGEGSLSKRQKRLLRWMIRFEPRGTTYRERVQDHLRQFAALDGILAFPDPNGMFYVYREPSERPPRGSLENLSGMDRCGIWDCTPETAAALGRELNLPFSPRAFIVFFPRAFEERLVKLEEQFRGQREDEIRRSIHFLVVVQGGTCDVIVNPDQSGGGP